MQPEVKPFAPNSADCCVACNTCRLKRTKVRVMRLGRNLLSISVDSAMAKSRVSFAQKHITNVRILVNHGELFPTNGKHLYASK